MKQRPNAAIGGGQMGLCLVRDVIVAVNGGKCSYRLGTAGLAPSKDAMLFWVMKTLDVDAVNKHHGALLMRSEKRPRAHDTRHSAADDTFTAEV
jgi:hypothetical protein